MEDDLNILKVEYMYVWIVTYEFLGGKWRKTQRKSRMWLCSAQLVFDIFVEPPPTKINVFNFIVDKQNFE